jgi:hypothetical protein
MRRTWPYWTRVQLPCPASDATLKQSGFRLGLLFVAQQIGIGLAVGFGLTVAGGWILKLCAERKWITETWRQLPVVALALMCFAAAQAFGGSGFIASFTGGILFWALAKYRKHDLLHGLMMLKNACIVLTSRCVTGIKANRDRCRHYVENSIGLVTALNPVLGYEKSVAIAKEALESGRSVYQLALEKNWLSKKALDDILKPENMTNPREIPR